MIPIFKSGWEQTNMKFNPFEDELSTFLEKKINSSKEKIKHLCLTNESSNIEVMYEWEKRKISYLATNFSKEISDQLNLSDFNLFNQLFLSPFDKGTIRSSIRVWEYLKKPDEIFGDDLEILLSDWHLEKDKNNIKVRTYNAWPHPYDHSESIIEDIKKYFYHYGKENIKETSSYYQLTKMNEYYENLNELYFTAPKGFNLKKPYFDSYSHFKIKPDFLYKLYSLLPSTKKELHRCLNFSRNNNSFHISTAEKYPLSCSFVFPHIKRSKYVEDINYFQNFLSSKIKNPYNVFQRKT